MSIRDPKGAIGSRLNSANYEDDRLSWLRKGITFSDTDLKVDQNGWHVEIEGKCLDWEITAKKRLHAAALNQSDKFWDFYHDIYKKIPAGQRTAGLSAADHGYTIIYSFNHKRLRHGFSDVQIYKSDSRMYFSYSGPSYSTLTEMAHPYIHTPLCFALIFYSHKVLKVAFDYLQKTLSPGCLVMQNNFKFAKRMLFVYLPVPTSDQTIEDIDNDHDAAIVAQGLATHLAQVFGHQNLSKLLELADDETSI